MDLVHVPYKGATPGLIDLVAGHVALMFTSALSTASVQRSGKVRVLARIAALGADIMTSTPERFAAFIKTEQAKWGQAIKDSGARVD